MGLGEAGLGSDVAIVILLQLVDAVKPGGGADIDLEVADVGTAVAAVLEIGGALRKPPALYPDAEQVRLEWAVMQDPFGKPFCLIHHPD